MAQQQQKPCAICGAREGDTEADDQLKDDVVALCYSMKEYDEKNQLDQPNQLVVPTSDWSFARMVSFARKLMDDTDGDFQVELDSEDSEESKWIKVTWLLDWNRVGEKKRKLI